jgi:hypothetical protein
MSADAMLVLGVVVTSACLLLAFVWHRLADVCHQRQRRRDKRACEAIWQATIESQREH